MSSAPVWDRFVRFFHWTNGALFLITYWLLEGGDDLHAWAGYAIALLVCARIVWGFCGSTHARFRDFFPTPQRLRRYIAGFPRSHADWPGHNPVGGLMILGMLLLLSVVALTGWLQTTAWGWGEEWLQNLHAGAADAVMLAIPLHVGAVLVVQRITGKALVRAMVTGQRSR